MKKIEIGSIKHLIVEIIAMIIAALIIYPLFDLIYFKLITNSNFTYTVKDYIIEPIIDGTVMGIIFWLIEKITLKKKGTK